MLINDGSLFNSTCNGKIKDDKEFTGNILTEKYDSPSDNKKGRFITSSSSNESSNLTYRPNYMLTTAHSFYDQNNNFCSHGNNKSDSTDHYNIERNVLIEPISSYTTSYLQSTGSRSRTPSPIISDDSGYASKQMSPVSVVST